MDLRYKHRYIQLKLKDTLDPLKKKKKKGKKEKEKKKKGKKGRKNNFKRHRFSLPKSVPFDFSLITYQ